MPWFRRLTLRGRLILIGTAGLAVGLAVGGLLLVSVLNVVLERAVDTGARQTARDVAALVDAGQLTDPIPTAGSQIVQVLDESGGIRSASWNSDSITVG